MTAKQWARIREGVIGTFQPLVTEGLEPAPGMIKLSDEHAEVTFIAGKDHLSDHLLPQDCRAVFGKTEAGDVLMLSISSEAVRRAASAQRDTDRGAWCSIRRWKTSTTTPLSRFNFTTTAFPGGPASERWTTNPSSKTGRSSDGPRNCGGTRNEGFTR